MAEKVWWITFSITVECFPNIKCPCIQELLGSITWRFSKPWPYTSNKNAQNCIRLVVAYTMPMCAYVCLCCYLIFDPTKYRICTAASIESWPCSLLFSLSSPEIRDRGSVSFYSTAVLKKKIAVLKTISKNGFYNVFQDWQTRWGNSLQIHGKHFEKYYV